MGRIKTTFIKRKTKELLATHGDKFSTDFSKNKELTNKLPDNLKNVTYRNLIIEIIEKPKQFVGDFARIPLYKLDTKLYEVYSQIE